MSRMIWSGASWSGREKHCAYLNLGDGTFANVSAVTGLDYPDDARALTACDWDRDGDLDLWIKNRTGPQLRFLRNQGKSGNFVSLELRGTTCNRDAIGARVELSAGGRTYVQTVCAGSGYLAQSPARLHFGLGDATKIDRVQVRWPGGVIETIAGLSVGHHYQFVQGADKPVRLPERNVNLAGKKPAESSPPLAAARTVLRRPVPLPDDVPHADRAKGKATLITFWANWCSNCQAELTEFTAHNEHLTAAGVNVVPISLDKLEDAPKARRVAKRIKMPYPVRFITVPEQVLFTALLRNVLDIHDAMAIPLSLLVDADGAVRIIYTERVSVEQLIADAGAPKRDRSSYPGRWYDSPSRGYADIVDDLKQAKLRDWARFYLELDRAARNH